MSYFHINEANLVLSCANKLDLNSPPEGRINCLFSMNTKLHIISFFFPTILPLKKVFHSCFKKHIFHLRNILSFKMFAPLCVFYSKAVCYNEKSVVLGVRMDWVLILGTPPTPKLLRALEKVKLSEFSLFCSYKSLNPSIRDTMKIWDHPFIPVIRIRHSFYVPVTERQQRATMLSSGSFVKTQAGAPKGVLEKSCFVCCMATYCPTKARLFFRIFNKSMSNFSG